MKIGVITSGLENIVLFKILQKYDHHYIIYWDKENFSYEDKSLTFTKGLVEKGLKELQKMGVKKFVVHPIFELEFGSKYDIIPFYQSLIDECLTYSLVGKIGLLGNSLDLNGIDFKNITKDYTPTKVQLSTKSFSKKFKFYQKEVPMWKYYLMILGSRNRMIRKTIKFDIGYFFDSNIDTILPTSWTIYGFERPINQKKKKIRFHLLESIEPKLKSHLDPNQDQYKIEIIGKGDIEFFLRNKKWKSLIYRGKTKAKL